MHSCMAFFLFIPANITQPEHMKSKVVLFLLIGFIPTFLMAQSQFTDFSGQLHLGAKLGFPQNEFAAKYPNNAFFGLGGGMLFPLFDDSPLDLGGQFEYYWIGREVETMTLESSSYGEYEVESTVNGSMIPLYLNARIMPFRRLTDVINPYFEGIAGARFFSIKTKIEVDDLSGGAQPDPETDTETRTSWSYGYGGGFLVKLVNSVYLDLHVQNIYGTQTKYLDPKSIEFDDNGDPVYRKIESETQVLTYSLGVNFVF